VFQEDQILVNGDYLVNAKNTLSVRYFYSRAPRTINLDAIILGALPGNVENANYNNTNAVLKLTSIVTNSFINEARMSFQRLLAVTANALPDGYSPQNLGMTPIVPSMKQGPIISFLINGFTIGGFLDPSNSPANQFQYADQISWSHGKHTVRAGFEFEKTQWNLVFAGLERGWLFMGSFSDLLNGGPGNILQCLFCVRSGPDGIIHAYREPNLNSYVHDDWKVSSKLTLNMGVRWEYDGTLSDKFGNLTNTWISQLAPNSQVPTAPLGLPANYAGYVVPNNYRDHYPAPPSGILVSDTSLPIRAHPHYSNFGPRLGFAYQAASKLVVRGGAGIFYDHAGADRFVHSVEEGNPYSATISYGPGNPQTLANPFPAVPAVGTFAQRWANLATGQTSSINHVFLNEVIHTPLVRQYNVNFQYEFAPRWVLEAGYVGSSGINLTDYNHNYNPAAVATPGHPVNGVTTTTTANAELRVPYLGFQPTGLQGTAYDGVSSYNSLQITARKQFSAGFTMQAAYTWSKSLTNIFNATANSNLSTDLAQQYGPANFNRPQRFVVSYGWDLPTGKHSGAIGKLLNGWNLSGVTTVQNGLPLTFIDTRSGTAYGTSGTRIDQGYSRAQMCPGVRYSQIASPGDVKQRLGGASGGPGYWAASAFCAPRVIGDPEFNFQTGKVERIATDFGNSGVGILSGPGQFNFDFSVLKTTQIAENSSLQFRAEFFNLFNHPQFSLPSQPNPTNTDILPDVGSLTGGWITSTSVNPRVIQLALKSIF